MPSGDDGPHGPWEDWRDASPGQGLKQALERARAEQEDIQRRRRRKSPHSTLRSALSIAVIALVIGLGLLFQTSRGNMSHCTAKVLRGEMTVGGRGAQTLGEGASVTISEGSELALSETASARLAYGCFQVVLGPRSRARLASREFVPRTGSFRLESDFHGIAGMTASGAAGSGAYLRLNTPAAIVTLRCDEPWLAAVHATAESTTVVVGSGMALVEPTDSPWMARKARKGQLIVASPNTLRLGSSSPPKDLEVAMETTQREAQESWTRHYTRLIVTEVASLKDAVGL